MASLHTAALLALLVPFLVQSSPEEVCPAVDAADDDAVELLQGRAELRGDVQAAAERAALRTEEDDAIGAALALLETGWWKKPWRCEHETETGCPLISCGPGMVNLSCANDDLGTGRVTCGACNINAVGLELARIRTEDVAKELSFAGPGSAIPEIFHGIFWMDQYGHHPHPACDPAFKWDFSGAPELLLTFGDTAIYNPATGCITDKLYYGGAKGGWTYLDQGGGDNKYWWSAYHAGAVFSFCEVQKEPLTMDIEIKIKFYGIDKLGVALREIGFTRLDSGYWVVPMNLLGTFSMVKTCFGWDRVTVSGPPLSPKTLALVKRVLPRGLTHGLGLNSKEKVKHYPVYQIVDGSGQKTKYWGPFNDWVSNASVARGINKDGAGMLVGRPHA